MDIESSPVISKDIAKATHKDHVLAVVLDMEIGVHQHQKLSPLTIDEERN